MSLTGSLGTLSTEMEKLRDAVRALRLIVEDRPTRGEAALVDRFAYAAVDMMDWLDESAVAVQRAKQCSDDRPADLEGVRDGLTSSQERIQRVLRTLVCDVDNGEAIGELVDFGRQRRGEWLPWTAGVRNSITACKVPLMDVSQALAQCWQDLTERIGTRGLRMREAAVSAVLNEPVSA